MNAETYRTNFQTDTTLAALADDLHHRLNMGNVPLLVLPDLLGSTLLTTEVVSKLDCTALHPTSCSAVSHDKMNQGVTPTCNLFYPPLCNTTRIEVTEGNQKWLPVMSRKHSDGHRG